MLCVCVCFLFSLCFLAFIMAVLYVVQESHYVLRLYFILLLLFFIQMLFSEVTERILFILSHNIQSRCDLIMQPQKFV